MGVIPLGPPKLPRETKLKLTFDGNSLVAGDGSTSGNKMPDQAARLVQTFFADTTYANLGIGGQTTRNMDGLDSGSASDVDAAWDATRTNILLVWETTNAIFNAGRTAAQAAGDMQSYVTNRLAAHPGWKIIVLGTLPRQQGNDISNGQTGIASHNATAVAADALIRDNLRAWGAKTYVDLRCAGSPFRYADYATTTFANDDALWNETAGGRVHLTDAGYAIVAGLVARAILNLAR